VIVLRAVRWTNPAKPERERERVSRAGRADGGTKKGFSFLFPEEDLRKGKVLGSEKVKYGLTNFFPEQKS
jgi:hypothetical protein